MRESLRLNPTAPVRVVVAHEDTTIGGGKYFIAKGAKLVVNTDSAQRDPSVYGEDVRISFRDRAEGHLGRAHGMFVGERVPA